MWFQAFVRTDSGVSLPFVFSVAVDSLSSLLWKLRRPCNERETPWPPQLSLSLHILSIHWISWPPNTPSLSCLNMTLCIHLSFPSQINNSIGSSPHGLCHLLPSPSPSPLCVALCPLLLFFYSILLCQSLELVGVFHGWKRKKLHASMRVWQWCGLF